MWVNSKQAAEILGVNNKSVEKAAFRSKNAGKKFCTIKSHICYFEYIDGNRGGAAGKTLQIWIDDDLINNKNSEISRADKASAENLVNTASVRPLNFTNGESDGDIYADTKSIFGAATVAFLAAASLIQVLDEIKSRRK